METSVVMKALRRQGVEEIFVNILEDIFKANTSTIKQQNVCDQIPIQK